jgi:hypothetical protein
MSGAGVSISLVYGEVSRLSSGPCGDARLKDMSHNFGIGNLPEYDLRLLTPYTRSV